MARAGEQAGRLALLHERWAPILETDDGILITESKRIVAWTAENPAR